MSLGVEKLLPSDCLTINEYRAIHMNTNSDAHEYSPGRVAQSVTCLATDCRSWGREFDPGPVPYFRGD